MILKDHKKHGVVPRPSYGNFGRNEWAILGTACGAIQTLADAVISALSGTYECAYVDANHADQEIAGRLRAGAAQEYISQAGSHQFNINKNLNQFAFRQLFSNADLVLVNGNHHQANAQVVVIDPVKRASLQKRVAQLSNVQLILLTEPSQEVFDFIKEAIPAWQQLPVYNLEDTGKIVDFFQQHMNAARPRLNGLCLAGGRSERMGIDKGSIRWHGKEQRYYMADLLGKYCDEVFISCRIGQAEEIDKSYQSITDTFTGLGPFGAILSAFQAYPENAWLVAACDLPFVDEETLTRLVENRSVKAIATTYESPENGFPEPLITIWEPKSYPVLMAFLAQGYTCPRKVLINSNISLLKPERPEVLMNVNTPAESEHAKMIMNQRG